MIKRILGTAILILMTGIALGQVKLKLPDTTAVPGSSISLPIMVEGFKNIGSLSLTVAFDNKVMIFGGIVNPPAFGFFNATKPAIANDNGAVAISWFNVSPSLNILSGKLLDLLFTYKTGTSPLEFVKMVPSSVTDSLANNLKAAITNGKVSPRVALTDSLTIRSPSGMK